MLKNCFVLFFFCELLTLSLSIKECITPNQKQGQCIPVSQCTLLSKQFIKKEISAEETEFIRLSQCGYSSICCGEDTTFTKPNVEKKKHLSKRSTLLNSRECGLIVSPLQFRGFVPRIGSYTWNALLQYKTASRNLVFGCGGSLINKLYILTAAHCVTGNIKSSVGELVSVRLGEHDLRTKEDCQEDDEFEFKRICSDPVLDIPVESVIVHPNYLETNESIAHDIALVKLVSEIEYSDYIRPICMPAAEETESKLFAASGWGITSAGRKSAEKKEISLKLIPNDKCKAQYKPYNISISDSHICVEDSSVNDDSCLVESGGPLLTYGRSDERFYLEGINSIRVNCKNKKLPQIFTKVEDYVDWIKDNIKEKIV